MRAASGRSPAGTPVRPPAGSSRSKSRSMQGFWQHRWGAGRRLAQAPEELDQRRGAALGLLVPDEVPGALDHDELRIRELALEPVGPRERRELVALAPEQEDGHAQAGEPVGGELLEVARAVELQRV